MDVPLGFFWYSVCNYVQCGLAMVSRSDAAQSVFLKNNGPALGPTKHVSN